MQQREAELLWREAERTQQLDEGSEQLLTLLVRAANGDYSVRTNLSQQHPLWRIGNALNVLLSRLRRISHVEQEVLQLRNANARLNQLIIEANMRSPFTTSMPSSQGRPMGDWQTQSEENISPPWFL